MTQKKYNIAVVGATGIVGETLLILLEARNFPIKQLFLLASEKSAGKTVSFRDDLYLVEPVDQFDFSKVDIAFFAAGTEVSLHYAPIAAKVGCTVIDKSTAFRKDEAVPLIVPEVNPEHLPFYHEKKIIANPNCNTIPVVAAIKPIHDHFTVSRMNVATYQSVSGAGKNGITALAEETANLLNGQPISEITLGAQIAFNVIPKIDDFYDNGYTLEEMKIVWETQKILNDDKILINPTAVRVPVFFGHSAAVHLETKEKFDLADVRLLLQKTPGIIFMGDEAYPTPALDATDNDGIFVGRLRRDISCENGLNFWVVSDNVRKGAALNAIQIAELLIKNNFYRH
ncbi:MAG: aspartate-semialdehyde dehydrogenase [Coxiellaceae bacterium]|nr:aspartate-semialdehyde dehydrogenase [Coxiellaceae bacterium]